MKMQTLPCRERILKLAKWAQLYIAKLERDIAALKAERKRVGAGKTSIYWSMFRDDGDHYLPARATIAFITAEGGRVEVSLREGRVCVRAYDGALTISPVAANSIEVVAEKGY